MPRRVAGGVISRFHPKMAVTEPPLPNKPSLHRIQRGTCVVGTGPRRPRQSVVQLTAMAAATAWPWWACLVAATGFNFCAASKLLTRRNPSKADRGGARSAAAWVFTVVCGYRSILPRVDVPRLCWFDTPLNWVLFGRASATVAELAWAFQMTIFLQLFSQALSSRAMLSAATAKRAIASR
jgi:hypothetical protein